MFCATVRSGISEISWKAVWMPSPCAARGVGMRTVSPNRAIAPASGGLSPLMILTRVDLPAPFSPSRAWTSPAGMASETSRKAIVAPNALLRPRIATAGGGSGIGEGGRGGSRASRRAAPVPSREPRPRWGAPPVRGQLPSGTAPSRAEKASSSGTSGCHTSMK